MAEGGMEYKNPEFNKDDFDDFDNNIYEESPYETPQFQTTLDIRNESLTTLTGIGKGNRGTKNTKLYDKRIL